MTMLNDQSRRLLRVARAHGSAPTIAQREAMKRAAVLSATTAGLGAFAAKSAVTSTTHAAASVSALKLVMVGVLATTVGVGSTVAVIKAKQAVARAAKVSQSEAQAAQPERSRAVEVAAPTGQPERSRAVEVAAPTGQPERSRAAEVAAPTGQPERSRAAEVVAPTGQAERSRVEEVAVPAGQSERRRTAEDVAGPLDASRGERGNVEQPLDVTRNERGSVRDADQPSVPPQPLLAPELRVLREAWAAVDRKDFVTAQRAVDTYFTAFPSGQLRDEAAVLGVLSACGLGDTALAAAFAKNLTSEVTPAYSRLADSCLQR